MTNTNEAGASLIPGCISEWLALSAAGRCGTVDETSPPHEPRPAACTATHMPVRIFQDWKVQLHCRPTEASALAEGPADVQVGWASCRTGPMLWRVSRCAQVCPVPNGSTHPLTVFQSLPELSHV